MVDTFDNEQRLALGKASEAPWQSDNVFTLFPNFVAVRFFESEDILDALKRDKRFPQSLEQQVCMELFLCLIRSSNNFDSLQIKLFSENPISHGHRMTVKNPSKVVSPFFDKIHVGVCCMNKMRNKELTDWSKQCDFVAYIHHELQVTRVDLVNITLRLTSTAVSVDSCALRRRLLARSFHFVGFSLQVALNMNVLADQHSSSLFFSGASIIVRKGSSGLADVVASHMERREATHR